MQVPVTAAAVQRPAAVRAQGRHQPQHRMPTFVPRPTPCTRICAAATCQACFGAVTCWAAPDAPHITAFEPKAAVNNCRRYLSGLPLGGDLLQCAQKGGIILSMAWPRVLKK
jgi:hypothetical protein